MGPDPELPPEETLIPTHRAGHRLARGSDAERGAGPRVVSFADGLEHPRWLYVLPNGDVLVAETNAPPRPERRRHRGW